MKKPKGRPRNQCIYCGAPPGVHDACPAISNGLPCRFPGTPEAK